MGAGNALGVSYMSVFKNCIYSMVCSLLCISVYYVSSNGGANDFFQIRELWGRGRRILSTKLGYVGILEDIPEQIQETCEELFQGVKQGEQIHYSLGTKNCLRELARTGRSTSILSSLGVIRTSERVDMRVERLRRPKEPGTIRIA